MGNKGRATTYKEQAIVSVQMPMENSVRHQDESIPHGEGNAEQITEQIRSGRMMSMPVRLRDYHMFPDSAIIDEGEFVNIALMTATKPVKFQDVVKEKGVREREKIICFG